MCSLFDAREARARKGEVFANVSAGADTKANTRGRGRGALNLCLTQHLRELGSPLRTDTVVVETAKDGQGGYTVRESRRVKGL